MQMQWNHPQKDELANVITIQIIEMSYAQHYPKVSSI